MKVLKQKPMNGSGMKLLLSHYTKDSLPPVGTNSARTLWNESSVYREDSIQDLSQLYDKNIAGIYNELWMEIMAPKLDSLFPSNASIQWWDPAIILCSRQILWMLGDILVQRFGPVYQSFSNSMRVYSLLPLPTPEHLDGSGSTAAVFWPEAHLPTSMISSIILTRYNWMRNEVISSFVSSLISVDDCTLNPHVTVDWAINVTKLSAMANPPCFPAVWGVKHHIGGYTCIHISFAAATVGVFPTYGLFGAGKLHFLCSNA
jgi:hypothetical protein